jgi:hypothetical protein
MNNPALPHAKTLSPIPVISEPGGKGKEKNSSHENPCSPLKSLDSDEIVRYLRKINGLA